MWVNRHLNSILSKSINSRPAVLLTGARQTGKSSLLKRMFPEIPYITFDFLRYVDAAKESPEAFLKQFDGAVILDEIQYVPDLFRELKVQIDTNRDHYGRWIMTGSQQFVLMSHIADSLAGRLSIMHLETLSAAELRESPVLRIEDYVWKGGYPELWSNEQLGVHDFFESYVRSYVERDLKQIIDVKNLSDFRRFIKVTASRVGQLLNYKGLSNDVGVSDVTVRKWIHALQVSGLIYLIQPYYANIGKRLVKSPKLYFADHGLLCHFLGIDNMESWRQHPLKGHVWENIVCMELIKCFRLIPGQNLFFYRDQNGVEIDFIVEKGNILNLIEAKSSERVEASKLNFRNVLPLFSKTHTLHNIVALNTPETYPIAMKDWVCCNPLHTMMPVTDEQ